MIAWKIIAAGVTVFVTSGDDCLWLIPFVMASNRCGARRTLNAVVWLLTLVSVCFAAELIVVLGLQMDKVQLFRRAFGGLPIDICLSIVGTSITWLLALYFFVKWVLKRRAKAKKRQEQAEQQASSYGATDEKKTRKKTTKEGQEEVPSGSSSSSKKGRVCGDVCAVASLTVLGALDEVSYFPSLLLTKTFTLAELTLGTFIACAVMLLLLWAALSLVKPVLDAFDSIPLWVVVALYAAIMSVSLGLELRAPHHVHVVGDGKA